MLHKTISIQLLIMLLFITNKNFAQGYTFSKDTQLYQNLVNPIKILENESWNYSSPLVVTDIGFTFKYFNRTYTQFDLLMVGSIGFDRGSYEDFLYGFNAKLKSKTNSMPWLSKIVYKIEGAAPNRIFKLEHNNIGFQLSSDTSNYLNFQIWLFETSNNIEIHYGPTKADSSCWYVGKTGPYVGMDTTNQWVSWFLAGNPSNPSFIKIKDTVLTGFPINGTVYKFTPVNTGILDINSTINNIDIYPNPTINKTIYFNKLSNLNPYQITIKNGLGETLYSDFIKKNEVNLAEFEKGIYFYQIRNTKDEVSNYQKLILE